MDYRSRILAAIDALHQPCVPITAEIIQAFLWGDRASAKQCREVPGELRAMSKAGLVVYDRKASGWRRA